MYFKNIIWSIKLNLIQNPLELVWILRVYFISNYLNFYKKDSLPVNKLTTWKISYILTAELQTLLKAIPFLLEREIIKALEK